MHVLKMAFATAGASIHGETKSHLVAIYILRLFFFFFEPELKISIFIQTL